MDAEPIDRHLDGDESLGRPCPRRGIRPVLAAVARIAALALLHLLRAALLPRRPGIADLTDRQLADIGLSRADVPRPHDRDVRMR